MRGLESPRARRKSNSSRKRPRRAPEGAPTNYFKVAALPHPLRFVVFTFVDGDIRSTANAHENALYAADCNQGTTLSVWHAPTLSGPWSDVRVVGVTT